jgi:hypothetical protein
MFLEIISHLRISEVQNVTEVVVAYFRWSYRLRIIIEGFKLGYELQAFLT